MWKVIVTAPMLNLDIAPWNAYESPTTGKMITSRSERERDLRESGCRPWEGIEQESKEAARQQKYQEEAADKQLDNNITEAFKTLPESVKALIPA